MSDEKKIQEKQEKKQAKKEAKAKKAKALVQFPANKKGKHVSKLMNLIRVLFYPLHRLVYPFKIYGNKKAPDGALIYVGNHYHIFDVFFPARSTWEGVHFLAKQSILDAPILGPVAKKVGVIGAMRDGTDVRTVMDSLKILKNGEKLSIFPEGTRNKSENWEEFLPFHGGAAMMAIKTKTPVMPFVICNKTRAFHKTYVVFGEPFEFNEYYGKKLTQEDYDKADETIRAKLYELRDGFRQMQAEKCKKKCK